MAGFEVTLYRWDEKVDPDHVEQLSWAVINALRGAIPKDGGRPVKKHSNSAKKCEPSAKRAQSRVSVVQDVREVMTDLVAQLTRQLDGGSLPVVELQDEGRSAIRPNLDRLTVGVDLGDQWSNYCILGLAGETLAEGQFPMSRQEIAEFFQGLAISRVVVEVGTHSAWVQEVIASLGHEVLVANARMMEGSKRRRRKNDRIDAGKLARLGRVDPKSLYPIRHRSSQVREDLLVLRARDALVASRTELINTVRALVKTMGARLSSCSSEAFAKKAETEIPSELRETLQPLLRLIATLNDEIKSYDQKIEQLASKKYSHTKLLRQVTGGRAHHRSGLCVDPGNSTALCQESRCWSVSWASAQAGGLRRQPAAIGHQQGWRPDVAQTAGGKRALYPGTVWAGYRLATIRNEAV